MATPGGTAFSTGGCVAGPKVAGPKDDGVVVLDDVLGFEAFM
ncbi:MAG: hypothetical protein V4695_01585 [Pseudomonadota bacterium]